MNIYALIILVALMGNFFLELAADRLNLRALNPQLPAEFAGIYDQEKYARSQEYTRVRTRFGNLVAFYDLCLLLVFWRAGGFQGLDELVRASGFGVVGTGLLYSAILILAKTILSLPFKLYSTFVIEERFGFNRTTPRTFVTDLGKALLLGGLLGGSLLAAILAIFEYGGSNAWLWCWLVVTLFTLLVQFIAPTWIMPLFNKFTPLEEGELKDAILDFAGRVGFTLENVFVIDGSRRSGKSNAFFTGFGRHKRIALFDTLIAGHGVAELVAILAHEIGHYQKGHILRGILVSIVHSGVMLFLLAVLIRHQGLFSAFYVEEPAVYSGLIFFGLLLTPMELPLTIFLNLLSRKNEYEADRFAVEKTGDPASMVLALKKLSVHNLANLTPHPFYVFLHYSHPPLLKRLAAIRGHGAGS